MKLYVAGMAMPFSYEFKKGIDVIGIQRNLAEHICK